LLTDGVFTVDERGEGAINPYERLCGCTWGHYPPMLAKGRRWQEECAAGAANGIVLPCWW
jgi:hypothetical protein